MADEKTPTPAETAAREQEEKDRKAREDAEQAQLPYKWTQTIRDVEVTIPVPGNLKGRDLDVVLAKDKIKVAVRGQEAIIEVSPPISNKYQTALQNARTNAYIKIGPIPPPHPHRRILLDPRNHPNSTRQRNLHPPRQNQQDELVGARGDDSTQDRRGQDHARELEPGRFGRADEGDGGEDDV